MVFCGGEEVTLQYLAPRRFESSRGVRTGFSRAFRNHKGIIMTIIYNLSSY